MQAAASRRPVGFAHAVSNHRGITLILQPGSLAPDLKSNRAVKYAGEPPDLDRYRRRTAPLACNLILATSTVCHRPRNRPADELTIIRRAAERGR